MAQADVGQLGADHVRAVHLVGKRHLLKEQFMHAPQLLPLAGGNLRADERYQIKVAAAGLKVPKRERPVCPQRDQRQYTADVGHEAVEQWFHIVDAHGLTIAGQRPRPVGWLREPTESNVKIALISKNRRRRKTVTSSGIVNSRGSVMRQMRISVTLAVSDSDGWAVGAENGAASTGIGASGTHGGRAVTRTDITW